MKFATTFFLSVILLSFPAYSGGDYSVSFSDKYVFKRDLEASATPVEMKMMLAELQISKAMKYKCRTITASLLVGGASAEYEYNGGQGVWELGTDLSYGLALNCHRYLLGATDLDINLSYRKMDLEGTTFTDNINNRSHLYSSQGTDISLLELEASFYRHLKPRCKQQSHAFVWGAHYSSLTADMSMGWLTNATEEMESEDNLGIHLGYAMKCKKRKFPVVLKVLGRLVSETSLQASVGLNF